MPDILDSINAQQEQKQVRTRRRLFQLSHVLDQSSNTDLLPKYRYSELRFPLFNGAKTTTLLKSQLESSVPRNGCPAKGVPLFQWSWPRNGRKFGWKRAPVRLPPLSITTEKTESVNNGGPQSLLENDIKTGRLRPDMLQDIHPNANPEGAIPEKINKLEELDPTEKEIEHNLPEIKRRQLVVVIPYIQYDSTIDETEEGVDEDNDAPDKNDIDEKYQKPSLEYPCPQNKEMDDERFDQERDKSSVKTICKKQSENRRLPSKSNLATEGRKSGRRMRVLVTKTLAATEARVEQCCFSSGGDSSDNEDKNKEKSIVDFSHKVRVQWQKELRDILNISPDYLQDKDTAKGRERPGLPSCGMAAVLPPAVSNDNLFSLQNNQRKGYDKLTESVKQNDSHLKRLGACYNLALTHQMPLAQEIYKSGKRKQNSKALSELRTKKSARKPCNLRRHRDRSPGDSFDFHFFWNLLEASKSQACAEVKHNLNNSCKHSDCSSSELWAINSPVYKRVFFYKKKLK